MFIVKILISLKQKQRNRQPFTTKSIEKKLSFSQKKLLCKVPIFFTHRLGSTKVYQKNKKKVGVVI
jgi:hypothetical protein